MGGCISLAGCEESRGEGAEFLLADAISRGGLSLAGGEAAGGVGIDAAEGGESPRQVRLLEEEEEADESEVFVDSWGDTQALAGEAQVQVWVMGDQGPSAWPAWRD